MASAQFRTLPARQPTPLSSKLPRFSNFKGFNCPFFFESRIMAGVRGNVPCVKLTPISTLMPPASNCDIGKVPCDKTPMIY
jgi:hypothetical protein